MQIDWANAPDEFPVWIQDITGDKLDGSGWHRDEEDRWTDEYGRFWPKDCEDRKKITVHFRPAVEWPGTGLPPVGTVCEWKLKQEFQYVAAEVLFVSEKSIVLRRKDGFEWQEAPSRCCFRPIRTQEQIEAEEREEFANNLVLEMGKSPTGYPNAMNQARKIYDLGYRKQPKEDA